MPRIEVGIETLQKKANIIFKFRDVDKNWETTSTV